MLPSSALADMVAPPCTTCHTGYPAPNHSVDNCGLCHNPRIVIGGDSHFRNPSPANLGSYPTGCDAESPCHNGDGHGPEDLIGVDCVHCHTPAWPQVPMHTDAQTAAAHQTTTTGCTECHPTSLTTLHAAYPIGSPVKFNCMTCHGSTDPLVVAAISGHHTNCDACHGSVDHLAIHASTSPPACFAAGCHNNNIALQHNSNCATCHSSLDPMVVAAIQLHLTNCDACHGTVDHVNVHITTTTGSCFGAGCHNNNIAVQHNNNCATCHDSTDPLVVAAIAGHHTNCDACHGPTDHVTLHASSTTGDCFTAGCHNNNLVVQHNNNCATCHSSTDPTVVAAISGHDTNCDACHDLTTGHEALHDGGFTGGNCSDCHNQNIAIQHENNCATCHDSTDPIVMAAIASHNVLCSACHVITHGNAAFVGRGAADLSQGPNAYIYIKWDTVKYPAVTANNASSPHGNYTTTTVKCAVCHAVHYAAPAGAPVTNNGPAVGNAQAADTLLRMRAIDACGYCHVAAGNTVDNDPVYNGTWPASSADGHNLASPPCGECHASVHGAGAETTIPSLNGLILKGKDANANLVFSYENLDKNSSALERIQAVQTAAEAQGFGTAVTGFTVAQYSTTLFTDPTGPQVRQQAVGIFCAGCHDGAYNSTTAGAAVSYSTNPAGSGGVPGLTGLYAGHRTMATNTSSWNSLGNARSSGQSNAGAGFTVAFAPATDCRSCHDADNGFNNGKPAFPHAWGYVAGTGPAAYAPAAANAIFGPGNGRPGNGAIVAGTPTYVWLLSSDSAGNAKTIVGANNHVGAGGGTLQDGVCLKCHRGNNGASGVGVNF